MPCFHPNSAEEVNHILAAAVPALEQTAAAIESGGPVTEPKPTVFGKFMTYIVNPIFYATCVHDRAFTVNDRCIGCGKCATLCPMNNIELQGGKPRWNGHCTHCMACISYCPKAAIAYGKKSRTAGSTPAHPIGRQTDNHNFQINHRKTTE